MPARMTLLRGWYCNVGKPALLDGDCLSYVDLALDLLVFPDGRQVVLDEDEFLNLDLSPVDRQQALAALEELKSSPSINRRTGRSDPLQKPNTGMDKQSIPG